MQENLRRIVFLDHTAKLGGGEIALLNLVIRLDRSRYFPIIVLFSDGPLKDKLLEQGVEVHVLALSEQVLGARKDALGAGTLMKLKQVIGTLVYTWRLAGFIESLRPDLVHTNSLKSDVVGGIASRLARVPVVWHVRDRIDSDYLPPSVVRVFRRLCRVIPDRVIANSAATLRTLKMDDVTSPGEPPRAVVVHDGTQPPAQPANSRAPVSRDGPVVLVGRISRWKGQDVFIRAAAQVRKKFPDARFQIVGSALFGEEAFEQEIRRLAQDLGLNSCVEFTGFRSDVEQVIAQSRFLVHASTMGEPFGQVIIEAMAAGKPVVATQGGGVPEIVIDGVTGLLVPMGNATCMADAMAKLLANPQGASEMGQAGRQQVLDHFTIEHTARKMERVFEEIILRRA
jgi:glycosyltransferase involved in cell wall biosynthesis